MSIGLVWVLFVIANFLLMQWTVVLGHLWLGEYKTKKELLLKLIPGYFIICTINFFWDTFKHFKMLK